MSYTIAIRNSNLMYFSLREKPLAFYVFTESKQTFQKINRLTSAGAIVHNDTLMHASSKSGHVLSGIHTDLCVLLTNCVILIFFFAYSCHESGIFLKSCG